MWKTILAAVIAILLAWFAIKIVLLVLGIALKAALWLIMLALVAAVAIPIYLFVRQKLLT